MADGFQITETGSSITLGAEKFTLVFDKEHVGITSFKYETGGTWHECVESGITPPVLLCPYFSVSTLAGNLLYPSGGTLLSLDTCLPWFVRISQAGYLRNPSISECLDYEYEVKWCVWPSGRIACKVKAKNNSGSQILLQENAYRLNPADDQDIILGRDAAPNLYWFGFFSNNTSTGENDLSHDGIAVSFRDRLDEYEISENTNRIFRDLIEWPDGATIDQEFLLALSINGSWGDCTNSTDFQNRGDELSSDVLNPDPLDGSQDAGDVITGSPIGDGFDIELCAYTLST